MVSTLVDMCFGSEFKRIESETIRAAMLWRNVSKITAEYELLSEIATTFQGTVHKARHVLTNTLVAIKSVDKAMVTEKGSRTGEKMAEDAFEEAFILTQLQGVDGVVQLVDAIDDGLYFYIVTKYEKGGDLFNYLTAQTGKLSECEVRCIFLSICQSVSRVHQLGICHLDLSLENILLSESGDFVLGDFGVARCGDDTQESAGASTWIGKAKYMAPEILVNQGFDGFKADVYSLGVILFCLLYNSHPYESPSLQCLGYRLIRSGHVDELLDRAGLAGSRSPQAEELLQLMLSSPSTRVDLSEVLQHSWFMTEHI